MLIQTKDSPHAKAHQPNGADVRWTGGLWKERFDTCASATIPHILRQFDTADDTFHVLENFRIAAGEASGAHKGTPYGDGDLYKLLEAACYAWAQNGNAALLRRIEDCIALIARAQQPDGYISTKQIIGERDGSLGRLSDINDFEVYNFGHLLTAACAHHRLTGRESFLQIAIRAADYLARMYAEAARSGEVQTAVCPSHYMGLVELYRATGVRRYLEAAKLAIDLRDSVKNGTDDNQDRVPLREQRAIVGHAVRSTYLYAGVADLYLETGEEALKVVLDACWEDCARRKMYLTGGCGALYNGVSPYGTFFGISPTHQSFGYEYQLPNVTAYNETCAAVGSVLWNLRMFAISPQAKYFDVIERTLLNAVLPAVSLSGDKYFYENMLRRTRTLGYKLIWPLERRERLDCFCCPPNMARTIAESAEYAYMLAGDSVYCGIYGASRAKLRLDGGAAFTLVQRTDYPFDGAIRFRFEEVEAAGPCKLLLRIPGWCERAAIRAPEGEIILGREASGSYLPLEIRDFSAEIELTLDMPARLTCAHAKVEEDTNQVAVERGPLVYCLEAADVDLPGLDGLLLPSDAQFRPVEIEISGRRVLALETEAKLLQREESDPDALYRTLHVSGLREANVRLIPYYAWDNRGFGEMKIWLPLHLRS